MGNFKVSSSAALFAALPVFIEALRLQRAFFLGMMICGIWLLTAGFFKSAQSLFPRVLFRIAILFWFVVLAHSAWLLLELKPYWVVSLLILTFWEKGQESISCKPFQGIFWKGIGLWGLIVLVGGVQEIFCRGYFVGDFWQPISLFLLLGIVAWMMQQRRRVMVRE